MRVTQIGIKKARERELRERDKERGPERKSGGERREKARGRTEGGRDVPGR